jgi:hypothetical protein
VSHRMSGPIDVLSLPILAMLISFGIHNQFALEPSTSSSRDRGLRYERLIV